MSDRLEQPASAASRATLAVGTDDPAARVIDETDHSMVVAFDDVEPWLDEAYGRPDGPNAVICAGDRLRSAAAASGGATGAGETTTVTAVPDVSSLGRAAAEITATLPEDHSDVGLVVSGLDAPLAATSPPAVFRFLHVLIGYLSSADSASQLAVVVDDDVSETVLETMEPLFDTVERPEA
ncbi:MAG: hypothetical protein ABEJ35_02815 [Halobacteriaceae archaeon]